MLSRKNPGCKRQASGKRKIAQIASILRSSERTELSSFKYHFLHLFHKKFEHFLENNYVISFTIEDGLSSNHSIQNTHFKQ